MTIKERYAVCCRCNPYAASFEEIRLLFLLIKAELLRLLAPHTVCLRSTELSAEREHLGIYNVCCIEEK